jgi:hypothetical protein
MHDSGAIDDLTAQVNELARFCARLGKENIELRSQVSALSARQSPAAAMPSPSASDSVSLTELADRGINRRTVGVALAGVAAGAVGAAVLTDRGTRPAAASAVTSTAAGKRAHAELTAVEQTASATPTVTLGDGPSIAVNAALGNDFRVTLGGNRTLASPTGSVDGQRITFTIRQGSGGPHKITWSSQYKFGAAGAPVLSTTAGSADVIGFIYNHSLGSWLCVGAARGFSF